MKQESTKTLIATLHTSPETLKKARWQLKRLPPLAVED